MGAKRKPIVLVVDDSPSIRFQVKAILEKEGYTVRLAGNELGMLNFVDEYGELADLVIMDLNLNQANGFELILKLRSIKRYENIPVIILTEQADKESVATARKLSIKNYIAKPIDAELLRERIKKILITSENRLDRW